MTEHYFSGEPSVADKRATITAWIWDTEFTFTTASGVFAKEHLDKATDVLLRASPPPPAGSTLLDLGCGWGAIACAVAVASPDTVVHAIDTNTRALELTRINAERLELSERVVAFLPDDVPADATYDQIWSNPPIRIGKAALHDLLLRWLPRLTPDGTARLVVGKNLGADSLQDWLTDQGWPTARETSEKGFRVLVVRRPA
ncbi:methyltransferase [soil metagenome]